MPGPGLAAARRGTGGGGRGAARRSTRSTLPSRSLPSPRRMGPLRVLARTAPNTYRLDLPAARRGSRRATMLDARCGIEHRCSMLDARRSTRGAARRPNDQPLTPRLTPPPPPVRVAGYAIAAVGPAGRIYGPAGQPVIRDCRGQQLYTKRHTCGSSHGHEQSQVNKRFVSHGRCYCARRPSSCRCSRDVICCLPARRDRAWGAAHCNWAARLAGRGRGNGIAVARSSPGATEAPGRSVRHRNRPGPGPKVQSERPSPSAAFSVPGTGLGLSAPPSRKPQGDYEVESPGD